MCAHNNQPRHRPTLAPSLALTAPIAAQQRPQRECAHAAQPANISSSQKSNQIAGHLPCIQRTSTRMGRMHCQATCRGAGTSAHTRCWFSHTRRNHLKPSHSGALACSNARLGLARGLGQHPASPVCIRHACMPLEACTAIPTTLRKRNWYSRHVENCHHHHQYTNRCKQTHTSPPVAISGGRLRMPRHQMHVCLVRRSGRAL